LPQAVAHTYAIYEFLSLNDNLNLRQGLDVCGGKVTDKGVTDAAGYEYEDASLILRAVDTAA
jgi:alanine dehydrogenase